MKYDMSMLFLFQYKSQAFYGSSIIEDEIMEFRWMPQISNYIWMHENRNAIMEFDSFICITDVCFFLVNSITKLVL